MDENNNIINFNDADSIFIPQNINGDRSDYTEQKVGFFRRVPANCALVRINRFSGHISLVSSRDNSGNIIGGGFKIMPPFITKSILVPIIDRTIDYPVTTCLTADGIQAKVDIALKVKIVNPALYIKEGKYQLDQLNIKTRSLLREYIRARDFNDISAGKIELAKFDPKVRGERGGFAQGAYGDFEKRYGIRIESIQLKSCKLPDNLQELYDNEVEARRRKEAQRIELEARQEKAIADAKIVGISAKAEADRIQTIEQAKLGVALRILDMLENKDISRDQIAELIKVQYLGDRANTINILGTSNGNNSLAGDVAAGVIAGNRVSNSFNTNNVNRKSNVDRLIGDLKSHVAAGDYPVDALTSVMNSLNDENIKANVNAASEVKYQQILRQLLEIEREDEKTFGRH